MIGNDPINSVDEYGLIKVNTRFGPNSVKYIINMIDKVVLTAILPQTGANAFAQIGIKPKELRYVLDHLIIVPVLSKDKIKRLIQKEVTGGTSKQDNNFFIAITIDDPRNKGKILPSTTIAAILTHEIVHAVQIYKGTSGKMEKLKEDYKSPHSNVTWHKGTYINQLEEDQAEYVRTRLGVGDANMR